MIEQRPIGGRMCDEQNVTDVRQEQHEYVPFRHESIVSSWARCLEVFQSSINPRHQKQDAHGHTLATTVQRL
jgi:hypothetical protein